MEHVLIIIIIIIIIVIVVVVAVAVVAVAVVAVHANRTSLYGPIDLGVVATLVEEGEDSANSFSVCLGSKVFRAWKEGQNLGLGGEGMVVWHL
ncbi:hypothetical protein Tco_0917251 [Tanacetum coccineum]